MTWNFTKKMLGAALAVPLITLTACAQSQGGGGGGVGPGATMDRAVTYATAQTARGPMALELDLVRPNGPCDSLRPTVIMIHGGGFISGKRSTGAHRGFARSFAQMGWNGASISYPLAGDSPRPSDEYMRLLPKFSEFEEKVEGQFLAAVAAVEAAADAMAFFVANQDQYCADPERLVLLGSSAGAIASLTATYGLDDEGFSVVEPAAVVDFWGGMDIDIAQMDRNDVPLFIVHGTRDFTAPFSTAVDLYQEAQSTNTPAQLHGFRGKGHGWGQINGDSMIGNRTVEQTMVLWLREVLEGRRPETLRTMN